MMRRRRAEPRDDDPRSIRRDLFWGLGWGLFMAAGFSAFVLVAGLLRGEGDAKGIRMLEIVRFYLFGGIACGLLTGLLRPLGKTRPGMTVLCMVIGTAIYSFAVAFLIQIGRIPMQYWWIGVMPGVLGGAVYAQIEWKRRSL